METGVPLTIFFLGWIAYLFVRLYNVRAHVRLEEDRWQEFRGMIQSDPSNSGAYERLANDLLQAGYAWEAADLYRYVLRRFGDGAPSDARYKLLLIDNGLRRQQGICGLPSIVRPEETALRAALDASSDASCPQAHSLAMELTALAQHRDRRAKVSYGIGMAFLFAIAVAVSAVPFNVQCYVTLMSILSLIGCRILEPR